VTLHRAEAAVSTAPSTGPLGLLEREGELHGIDAAIGAAGAGRGGFVVAEGPPGVGKTALLVAARERATATGMRVAHARGRVLEREYSFGVARSLLEPLLRRVSSSERDELLDGAAAGAGPVVGFRGLPELHRNDTAVDVAFQALHGLFWLTANIAATAPLMLAIDDLQCCDAESLRWLAYLVQRIEGLPILVVAGVHSEDSDAHSDLVAEATADAHVLRPAPLSAKAVASLARDVLAGEPDEEFCVACHAATGGNPLLVRALLAAAGEQGVVPSADQSVRVCEIGSQAVMRLVRLRLARLAPEVRALAEACAILGDGAAIDHAAALAGVGQQAAADGAATLGQAGLLRADAALSFSHPVERTAVYDAIAPLQREAAHAHAARMLADDHASAQRIAVHLLHAPSQHEPFAIAMLRDAARTALGHGAADTAVAYLRRACCEPLPPSVRADVLVELGLAEMLAEPSAAAEHLTEAVALLEDDECRARAGLHLARALSVVGRAKEAVCAFEHAMALLPERSDLRRRLQAELLGVAMLRPELHVIAERQLERMESVPVQDEVGGRMLLVMSAHHDARRGHDRDGCADRAERALFDDTLFDEQDSSAFAYACRVLVSADRFDTAAAAHERAIERARERGSISSFAVGLSLRAGMALHRGALTDAENDARASIDAARAGGAKVLGFSLAYLALALLEQGRLTASTAVFQHSAQEYDRFGRCPFVLLVSGRLQHLHGDSAGALATTIKAAHSYTANGDHNPAIAPWRGELALTQLHLGEREAARNLTAEEVRLARGWGAPRTLGRALRAAGLVEGGEHGLTLLREAHAALEHSPARLERAKTLVELGAAIRRRGQRSEARELLRAGLDLADACGALPLAERARRELRTAGARPRRTSLTGPDALTPSEHHIATMAADGKTNRQIAQELFVTPKTVEAHLSSIYRKLAIHTRTHLPRALDRPADTPQVPIARSQGAQPRDEAAHASQASVLPFRPPLTPLGR
jgi:DNA-binding CsgD family transcriptional regulator